MQMKVNLLGPSLHPSSKSLKQMGLSGLTTQVKLIQAVVPGRLWYWHEEGSVSTVQMENLKTDYMQT